MSVGANYKHFAITPPRVRPLFLLQYRNKLKVSACARGSTKQTGQGILSSGSEHSEIRSQSGNLRSYDPIDVSVSRDGVYTTLFFDKSLNPLKHFIHPT
ncbi:hypothetical protein J6590_103316 [Homalodisca vitripennis]|nr:hypothetical protein J6590_103315 [Homalodisca vitripennis]KAG8250370.1 hypothetical protein J6590_103316 [Homalodisca vitripennis]